MSVTVNFNTYKTAKNPVLKISIKFYHLFLDQQCGCMVLFVPTGATVEPFGSFVSNLFTRWGDLDISIVLSNGSFISSAGKKRKQNLLGDVQKALRQRSELLHLYSYLLHVDIHEKSMRSINHVYFTTCNK